MCAMCICRPLGLTLGFAKTGFSPVPISILNNSRVVAKIIAANKSLAFILSIRAGLLKN